MQNLYPSVAMCEVQSRINLLSWQASCQGESEGSMRRFRAGNFDDSTTHHLHNCDRLLDADYLVKVLKENRCKIIRIHDAVDDHIECVAGHQHASWKWLQRQLIISTSPDLRLLTSHYRHAEIRENERRYVVINVEERHLLELLPQDKAYRFDELNAFHEIAEVQQLHVAEIIEARHVAGPQEVPSIAGAENVNEKIETREHLKDVVDGEEGSQLESRAILHQSANNTPPSYHVVNWWALLPRPQSQYHQINACNRHRRPDRWHQWQLVRVEIGTVLMKIFHVNKWIKQKLARHPVPINTRFNCTCFHVSRTTDYPIVCPHKWNVTRPRKWTHREMQIVWQICTFRRDVMVSN